MLGDKRYRTSYCALRERIIIQGELKSPVGEGTRGRHYVIFMEEL